MIAASAANASVYYSTNFSSGYSPGNLVGQNNWAQISTNSNTPIQVSSGLAVVGTSGQDVVRALTSTVPLTSSTTVYVSASLKVTAAQSAGDYFLGLDTSANGGGYYGRIFAKSSGAGFVLGLSAQTTTGTYGSTVLNLGETYTVVYAWDFVSGAANDTFAMYVNPTSSTRADLTSYLTAAWSGTEPSSALASIALRQGTASSAPSVSVGSLAVGSSLTDVGVPAPGALALLGVAGLVGSRRRR